MIADRALYLDRTRSRLVEETDPEVAWLLVWKGREVPAEDVKRLGLWADDDGRVRQGQPEPAPAANVWPDAVSDEQVAQIMDEPEPLMPPKVKRFGGRKKKD